MKKAAGYGTNKEMQKQSEQREEINDVENSSADSERTEEPKLSKN